MMLLILLVLDVEGKKTTSTAADVVTDAVVSVDTVVDAKIRGSICGGWAS